MNIEQACAVKTRRSIDNMLIQQEAQLSVQGLGNLHPAVKI